MVALAGPDLILIRPGMDPEVVVVAMETAVAMEMVVAMATEEEAEKVQLEVLVGLEESEEMAGQDLLQTQTGMDQEAVEVVMQEVMEAAMEGEVEEVMEEAAEKVPLEESVALEELEEMAGLVLLQILHGMVLEEVEEVMEVAMERVVVEVMEEVAEKVQLVV